MSARLKTSSQKIALASGACLAIGVAAVAFWPLEADAHAATMSLGEVSASTSELNHDWELGGNNDIWFIGNRVAIGMTVPVISNRKFQVRTAYPIAIDGAANPANDVGYGVFGSTASAVFQSSGVRGQATSKGGRTTGVYGQSWSSRGRGVVGVASATTGALDSRGGFFETHSRASTARGVLGIATSPAFAVFAQGNYGGTGGKYFQIDHPLDPANMWLNHYCSEGPEPLNVYSGNIALDGAGSAWVLLPDWFESINRDFRYQLTSIGAAAPNLHVAQPIDNNAFRIAGGAPGASVSWRVEAVRDDPYMRQYGAPVEVVKPAEAQGLFYHPELYGLPPEFGLHYEPMSKVTTEDEARDLDHELDIEGS